MIYTVKGVVVDSAFRHHTSLRCSICIIFLSHRSNLASYLLVLIALDATYKSAQ